ncbi:MAG: hypothetical protein ACE37F_22090 [Nannocystaceae bacterium]|nr:hypothetical protein [bacterium]
MRRPTCLLAILLATNACDADEAGQKVAAIKQQASDAADASKKLADDASKASKDAYDSSKQAYDSTKRTTEKVVTAGKDAAGKGKALYDSAARAWADIPGTGHLSDTAKAWLATATDEQTIEAVISEGKQIAPVAVEIAQSVSSAIDSDTAIEPIYQKIPEGEAGEVDAAIADMPRTEVVDGLTLGFKQLDESSNEKSVKERGYLITWRDGDHLYGFVYHSKRTIDVDKLVSEAPRLLALARAAVAE